MADKLGLRVALIWKGAVVDERIYDHKGKTSIVLSDDIKVSHPFVIPTFKGQLNAIVPSSNGFKVSFPEGATGSVSIGGKEETLAEAQSHASSSGSIQTTTGKEKVYAVELEMGDWAVITIGEVTLYIQVRDNAVIVPITGFSAPFPASLVATVIMSASVHLAFLMMCFLSAQFDPTLDSLRAQNRFASFMVDDVDDPIEEEEVEDDQPLEEDTTGKQAGGEEGKFGDEESDFDESKIPKNDGEMADNIDVKNIGLNAALSSDVLGSGALKNVFGNSDGFDAKMNVAMSGEGGDLQIGRGSGGMGFRGTGSGGGGDGLGRVGGLGKVDTGGGKGVGAKIGKRKTAKAKPKVKTGTPNLGDFCDKNNIRRVVGAKNNAIKYCFEKELQSNPSLSGKVIASWQVGLDGNVLSASIDSSTIGNKSVEGCITRVIKQMRFQKPDGGICVIKYPFVFTGIE